MFFHMVYKSGQIFLPFCHNPRMWQTDRRTDGRTEFSLLHRPRLHSMQRGKNPCCMQTWRLSSTETQVFAVKVWHCGNQEFLNSLLLQPWLWLDDLHIQSWFVLLQDVSTIKTLAINVEAFESYRITDRQKPLKALLHRLTAGKNTIIICYK